MVRNSGQDAIDDATFERLVEATDEFSPPVDAESMFILMAAGRLGMRAGELCHMRAEWINWDRQMIEIPRRDPCDKGIDGGPCGNCYKGARQAAAKNEDVTVEEDIVERWKPKTPNSARAIPFGFSDRVKTTLEMFFSTRDIYPHSRCSVNRRVTALAEAADLPPSTVYPHCLRATAATYHAYRGLPAPALQSLMGWANISVSNKYIRLSGGATAKALQDVHSSD